MARGGRGSSGQGLSLTPFNVRESVEKQSGAFRPVNLANGLVIFVEPKEPFGFALYERDCRVVGREFGKPDWHCRFLYARLAPAGAGPLQRYTRSQASI